MKREKVFELMEENMKTIFAYFLSRVSVKEDAEDMAGDIIAAILENSEKIRDDNAVWGYIWATASNTYKKYLKKKSCGYNVPLDENVLSHEDEIFDKLEEDEQVNILRRELSILSKQYRECTIAYYIEGLSCSETAQKLGISLEMVKYYLFKTRKILKEGIGMERKFGEKSYNTGKFQLSTIFSGNYNGEYRNMFNRRLPGNILLSAYYTPMTIRELSIELGVASVYMEDEVSLLEKYNLLISQNGGKYQTNLIIFTREYDKEVRENTKAVCFNKLSEIYNELKSRLIEIRKINFIGSGFDDNRLMWGLTPMIFHYGNRKYVNKSKIEETRDELYQGATGTNYGSDYDEDEGEYGCDAFAGYGKIDNDFAVSFGNFKVLSQKNYFEFNKEVKEKIYYSLENKEKPKCIIFNEKQLNATLEIMDSVFEIMAELYEELFSISCKIMREHAPKSVKSIIEKVIGNTLYFRTIGFIGNCIVKSGNLSLPDYDDPAAMYVYKISSGENIMLK